MIFGTISQFGHLDVYCQRQWVSQGAQFYAKNKNTKYSIDVLCHRQHRKDLRISKDCIEVFRNSRWIIFGILEDLNNLWVMKKLFCDDDGSEHLWDTLCSCLPPNARQYILRFLSFPRHLLREGKKNPDDGICGPQRIKPPPGSGCRPLANSSYKGDPVTLLCALQEHIHCIHFLSKFRPLAN